MNYRSITDLNDTIARNRWKLPHDVDIMVGIPRSGLLAANLLSLTLNVPMTDIEGLVAGRLLTAGRTRRREGFSKATTEAKKIIVVDDSIFMGQAMREARGKLAGLGLNAEIIYCAVYGNSDQHPDCDVVLEAIAQPRMFQWNVMHHGMLQNCCVDIDGVLCCDPTEDENDDGPAYEKFLGSAFSLATPTKKIGWLVTSRLEKYRAHTETWLKERGIEYGQLIMLDLPTKEERLRSGAHGTYKANVYKSLADAVLFIESEHRQAVEIARLSGKPALCTESQQVIFPEGNSMIAMQQKIRTLPLRLRLAKTPATNLQAMAVLVRKVLGNEAYGRLRRLVKRSSPRRA